MLYDCDFDGLGDPLELTQCLKNPDCDGDGIQDGAEIWACIPMSDCDGDGVNDVARMRSSLHPRSQMHSSQQSTPIKTASTTRTSFPQCVDNPDCDGDGVGDASELIESILMADCDGDGVSDSSGTTWLYSKPHMWQAA